MSIFLLLPLKLLSGLPEYRPWNYFVFQPVPIISPPMPGLLTNIFGYIMYLRELIAFNNIQQGKKRDTHIGADMKFINPFYRDKVSLPFRIRHRMFSRGLPIPFCVFFSPVLKAFFFCNSF